MNKQDIFDGFSIELFLDEEGDWIAHFEEFANVSACGSSPEEVLHELQTAWEAMKESYIKNDESVPMAPTSVVCLMFALIVAFIAPLPSKLHKQESA